MLSSKGKQDLLDLLNHCTNGQHRIFRRMYSHNDLKRPLEEIIEDMDRVTLLLSIGQTIRTVEKNKKRRDLKLKKIMGNYEDKKRICK